MAQIARHLIFKTCIIYHVENYKITNINIVLKAIYKIGLVSLKLSDQIL